MGNYPGVTVERKEGTAHLDGKPIRLMDLPGTYSLTAYSEEEIVVRRELTERPPLAVIDVVDASALERNLFLTVQLLELGLPVVLALNMMGRSPRGRACTSMSHACPNAWACPWWKPWPVPARG